MPCDHFENNDFTSWFFATILMFSILKLAPVLSDASFFLVIIWTPMHNIRAKKNSMPFFSLLLKIEIYNALHAH